MEIHPTARITAAEALTGSYLRNARSGHKMPPLRVTERSLHEYETKKRSPNNKGYTESNQTKTVAETSVVSEHIVQREQKLLSAADLHIETPQKEKTAAMPLLREHNQSKRSSSAAQARPRRRSRSRGSYSSRRASKRRRRSRSRSRRRHRRREKRRHGSSRRRRRSRSRKRSRSRTRRGSRSRRRRKSDRRSSPRRPRSRSPGRNRRERAAPVKTNEQAQKALSGALTSPRSSPKVANNRKVTALEPLNENSRPPPRR